MENTEAALDSSRHQERMRQLNESYKRYRADASDWEEELAERAILEGTLADGLEN